MIVKIDDEVIDDHFTTVVLCNGKYYGGGYKIGFNSKLNDDLIDVYLVPKMPKLGMAKLILGMNKGNHEKSEKVLRKKVGWLG